MTVTSPHYHIFLSHHAADQPAVEAIARLLRAADLTPFLDRWHLVPGDPWMEAIEKALASSETVAVFVGPSGIGPWQNEEMRVALYDSAVRGKRVIPVLLPGADPQRVSPFLTRRTWVDFRGGPEDADALQRLIAGIQGLLSEAGGSLSSLDLAPPKHYFTPFQAPPLPPYFVPRPDAAEAIRAALLDARSDRPGVLAISAIHGLGGIGKTTLIAALAHDPAIRQRYPDGILWATLGQQPELLPRLFEWIQQLGDYTFKPTTLEGASSHLRTLLIDKACLLVVDDAWQREHVDHFLVGGPRSQVVITTRDATLARKLRAHLHDLDVMTEAQALALFEGRLGTLSTQDEREYANALARELGYLPLALELAAAQIESGRSWDELLAHFRSAFADLAILDLDEAKRRDESLRISFALSLDSLAEEDRNAFLWFGALPEDAIIGPAMAATLWDETEDRVRERLRRLRHKALLKATGEDQYTVHDLLYDESRLRLAQQMSLTNAHAALLTRYLIKTTQDQWHTVPDDGYIHAHLTWHMEQAGQIDAIHALLAEETSDGHNGWYCTLDRLGQTAIFINDTALAWRHADIGPAIDLQWRYALYLATLNTLAGNIPAELLAYLVQNEIWSPVQAIAYLQQNPYDTARLEALLAIISYLPERLLIDALKAILVIQDMWLRSEALEALVPHFNEQQRQQGLEVAQAIEDGRSRIRALMAFGPYLSDEQRKQTLTDAFDAVNTIDNVGYQFQALGALFPYLSENVQQELLTRHAWSTLDISHTGDRVHAVAAIAPHMNLDVRQQILQDALPTVLEDLSVWSYTSDILAEFASVLDHRQRQQLIEAMFTHDIPNRAYYLAALAAYLDPSQRQQVLEAVLTLQEEWFRSEALTALAPHFNLEQQQQVLEATLAFHQEDYRSTILAALAPNLNQEQRQQALEVAKGIKDAWYRSKALAALASCLNERQRQLVMNEVQVTAKVIKDAWYRSKALVALAPNLKEPQRQLALNEALVVAEAVQNEANRSRALAALAPYLNEPQRQLALNEALVAAKAVEDEEERSRALAALAPYLNEPQRQLALNEALLAAEAVKGEENRSRALAALAPNLKEPQRQLALDEALVVAKAVKDAWWRSRALAELAPHLDLHRWQQAMDESLEAALVFLTEITQTRISSAVTQAMSEEQWLQAIETAQAIQNRRSRHRALGILLDNRDLRLRLALDEAVEEAQAIQNETDQSESFAALAANLIWTLEPTRALYFGRVHPKVVAALAVLASHLSTEQRQQALSEVLKGAQIWGLQGHLASALTVLIPHLSQEQRQQVLEAIPVILCEQRRSEVLKALAPYLDQEQQRRAMEAADAIPHREYRFNALVTLAFYLASIASDQLLPLWCQTLHTLAHRTRAELLSDLCALMPIIEAIATPDDMAEIAQAIIDVGRWWP